MGAHRSEGFFGMERFAGLAVITALGLLALHAITGNKAKKAESKKQG